MSDHTLLLKELLVEANNAKELRQMHQVTVEQVIADYAAEQQKKITLRKHESGKPFLEGDENHISISHSGSWIAVLISSRPHIGIDVQRVEARIQKLAHKFVHDQELTYLQNNTFSLSYNQQLTLIWCIKEAIYKAFSENTLLFKEQIQLCELIEAQNKASVQVLLPNSKNHLMVDYFVKQDYLFAYCLNDLME